MFELDALTSCLSTPACLVNQTTSGLIIGMLLFLVSSGVTLIFGVLHIINFAHGSFYMLGAYFAFSAYLATGNRSEEHTSELQSLMRISYAAFCLKKKNTTTNTHQPRT